MKGMCTVLAAGIAALHARIVHVNPPYWAQVTRKLSARNERVKKKRKNTLIYTVRVTFTRSVWCKREGSTVHQLLALISGLVSNKKIHFKTATGSQGIR